MSNWAGEVSHFESFLLQRGLARTRREESASFGSKVVEYTGRTLVVRVVGEKSVWFVEVSDAAGRPDEWYDAAIVRDLLGGRGPDALPLQDQIAIVEDNWQAIESLFSPSHRADSHVRVDRLRKQRMKRRFPGLHNAGPSP